MCTQKCSNSQVLQVPAWAARISLAIPRRNCPLSLIPFYIREKYIIIKINITACNYLWLTARISIADQPNCRCYDYVSELIFISKFRRTFWSNWIARITLAVQSPAIVVLICHAYLNSISYLYSKSRIYEFDHF